MKPLTTQTKVCLSFRMPRCCPVWLFRRLKIPLATLIVVLLCLSLFYIDVLTLLDYDHDRVCLQPHGIVRLNEVHRIFLHALFHKGPWHLAVTMIPTQIFGSLIERQLGTITFVLVLLTIWFFSVAMEVAMATMMYHIVHTLFHGCSLGFSGVAFGLLVLSSKYLKSEEVNIGRCSISFWFVPWSCVILYYAVFHRGSLFMHIGGICAGYGWKYDIFSCIVPSSEQLATLEESQCLQICVKSPCFVSFRPPILPVHDPIRINKKQLLQAVMTEKRPKSTHYPDQAVYQL